VLAANIHGAEPTHASSKPHKSETDYVKATCKVFVTEAGIPKRIEFLKFEPPIALSEQPAVKDAISNAVLTWTFKPRLEKGKPVAGYLTVPFNLHLAFPIPVDGT
jgi:hypothetical protein